MKRILSIQVTNRRRAAAAVMVAATAPVLIGFTALTIDVAIVHSARTDLQIAADAAALAAASELASDTMMQVRMGIEDTGASSALKEAARDDASSISALNPSLGRKHTLIEYEDVTMGWINLNSGTDPLQTGVPLASFNAVRVITRRENGRANGPVALFFARLMGHFTADVSASAVAAFDDRVSGFDPSAPNTPNLLPFTIEENYYENELATGGDIYEYDSGLDAVAPGSDGLREANLYPLDLAPGNFGLLNVGLDFMGQTGIEDQITNGVQPEHLDAEIATSELTFSDSAGSPVTYEITGNTGLTASLEPSIEAYVGQIVAFLLHDDVAEAGANATFRITAIRFGRLMDVDVMGSNKARGMWIQPVTYAGAGLLTSPLAPSSGGTMGRIVLAR